jgi:hypothetical protein
MAPPLSSRTPVRACWSVQPFALDEAALLPGVFADKRELMFDHTRGYDVNRLLQVFRANAGLPAGAAVAPGGWEGLDGEANGNLRGHYSGHFDFGDDTTRYMYLAVRNGSGVPRFAVTTSGADGEQGIDGTAALPLGEWSHLAVTIADGTGTFYANGTVVARNTAMSLTPAALGTPAHHWPAVRTTPPTPCSRERRWWPWRSGRSSWPGGGRRARSGPSWR